MGNILILYHFPPVVAGTSADHLDAFSKYSRNKIFLIDSLGGTDKGYRHTIPAAINLDWFDAVVIHYSIYMPSKYMLDDYTRQRISRFRGLKVAFIQDEYRRVNEIHKCLNDLAIDTLFTCVPPQEIEKVYPASKLPRLRKVNTLTGYVPEHLEHSLGGKALEDRPIDVGYRARKLSAWYGDLAQEKVRIGDGFLQCNAHLEAGLRCDISCDEDKRYYGEDWIRFIQSCRCMLGVESGASVFDFTGEIQDSVESFEAENPSAAYEEIKELFFKDLDGKIYLNQISPRCFEAIALKTPLILFKGDYSGILIPWRHYIPLKKDFSNFDEVVRYVRDNEFLQNMANTAFQDVVASGKYSYREFIRNFDAEIQSQLGRRKLGPAMLVTQGLLDFLISLEVRRNRILQFGHRVLQQLAEKRDRLGLEWRWLLQSWKRPDLIAIKVTRRIYSFAPYSLKRKLHPTVASIKAKFRARFK